MPKLLIRTIGRAEGGQSCRLYRISGMPPEVRRRLAISIAGNCLALSIWRIGRIRTFVLASNQGRISAMVHHFAPFRRFQFRFGLGISLCGLLCGCGTARSTVKLAPSSQARAVIASPESPKAELDHTSEIQGVVYSEVAAGQPLSDSQSTGWTLGTFESLALSNNPAIQQATASASKAVPDLA